MQYMFDQLQAWGFKIKIGATVGTSYFKFSATDEERVSDLQNMLDDTDIKAILFGRGGYGVVRIIDQLDFTQFCASPKWLVGYSDITCLHSHVISQFGIATMHAHMGGGYLPADRDEESTQSILQSLLGTKINYKIITQK
jgi:muramoyltetrapeptide carboxypeptidase